MNDQHDTYDDHGRALTADDDRHWDTIVVGCGIAGLTAAVTAADAGLRTLVLDAHRPGGRARTTARDGYLYNVGPHALYRAGHLHGLLHRFGVQLPGGPPDAVNVRLLRDGALTPMSMKAVDIMRTPLLGVRDRTRLLAIFAKLSRINSDELVGRSVAEWLDDTPEPVAQFVETLVRTTSYANGRHVVDAGATVDQLRLGLQGVDYLDGGWQSIVGALTSLLLARGGVIETDAPVAAVEADGGRVQVQLPFRTLTASTVIVAAGGPELAERLTGLRPSGIENLTPPVEAASLDLALSVARPGLVLGLDLPLYLSPHAPTARLAPAGAGLVTVLRYIEIGTDAGDPAVSRAQLRDLATVSGISADEVVHERYLHRSTVAHGAPAARGGGLRGRPTIDALGLPGVYLAGDWVGPCGMLADASSASGEAAARAAAQHCSSVPA
jgi:phytoene dehydrogenase-like protein